MKGHKLKYFQTSINKGISNDFKNVLHENENQFTLPIDKDKIVGFHLKGQK